MVMEIGRVCIKIAGRDAGKKCVVVDTLTSNTVLVDGQTRRRKCNTRHLEPTPQVLSIKKGASSVEVQKVFESVSVQVVQRHAKQKSKRPTQQRKQAKPAVKQKETATPEQQKSKESIGSAIKPVGPKPKK